MSNTKKQHLFKAFLGTLCLLTSFLIHCAENQPAEPVLVRLQRTIIQDAMQVSLYATRAVPYSLIPLGAAIGAVSFPLGALVAGAGAWWCGTRWNNQLQQFVQTERGQALLQLAPNYVRQPIVENPANAIVCSAGSVIAGLYFLPPLLLAAAGLTGPALLARKIVYNHVNNEINRPAQHVPSLEEVAMAGLMKLAGGRNFVNNNINRPAQHVPSLEEVAVAGAIQAAGGKNRVRNALRRPPNHAAPLTLHDAAAALVVDHYPGGPPAIDEQLGIAHGNPQPFEPPAIGNMLQNNLQQGAFRAALISCTVTTAACITCMAACLGTYLGVRLLYTYIKSKLFHLKELSPFIASSVKPSTCIETARWFLTPSWQMYSYTIPHSYATCAYRQETKKQLRTIMHDIVDTYRSNMHGIQKMYPITVFTGPEESDIQKAAEHCINVIHSATNGSIQWKVVDAALLFHGGIPFVDQMFTIIAQENYPTMIYIKHAGLLFDALQKNQSESMYKATAIYLLHKIAAPSNMLSFFLTSTTFPNASKPLHIEHLVEITLPNYEERKTFLSLYSNPKLSNEAIKQIANTTSGHSYTEIDHLVQTQSN